MSTLAVGGSRLRPLPLFELRVPSPITLTFNPDLARSVNMTAPFSAYSTLVPHGAVTNGPFLIGARVTSSSGGSGQITSSTGASIQVGNVTGTFLAGDTLTQTTQVNGVNSTATATQSGPSSVVGPFGAGEVIRSLEPDGTPVAQGTIQSVGAGSVVVTNATPPTTFSPFFPYTSFLMGYLLLQVTGAAAGATALQSGPLTVSPGLLADQRVDMITLDVSNYVNGRIRGNVHQDVEGTLNLRFGNDPANMDLDFEIPQDTNQPDFQYPFDVIVLQPVMQLSFVNGAAASAFLRAWAVAEPV